MPLPTLPLDEITVEAKLQTIEAIWKNLSSNPAAVNSPAWHKEELRLREKKIGLGKAKFVDWEKVKTDLRDS